MRNMTNKLAQQGIEAEVLDLRTLVPLDWETIEASVKKTHRVVVVQEAVKRGGYAGEIAAQIMEGAFDYLDAPPVVVGSRNWITPAYELEEAFFPQASWFLDAIHEKIVPLAGHVVGENFSDMEQMRRAKMGV